MPQGRNPNEVGAAWNKRNDKGEYLSISLDLDALLTLTSGATGKVNITAYPLDFEKSNPNSPDYRLKYYPRDGERRTPASPPPAKRPRLPLRDDDDIPFIWVLPLLLPLAGAVTLAHMVLV